MGKTQPLFCSFSHDKYSTNFPKNDISVDGVLGTRTQDGRVVGADESTGLKRQTQVPKIV